MRLLRVLLGAAVLVALTPAPAFAAPAGDFGSFFDRELPSRLAQSKVPGAVVSVVADGKEVFAKGYGTEPLDPATSLVRIASITKLFTWTAVMQQVQQGRLDLHADVNRYLTTFKIPATYPRWARISPSTCRRGCARPVRCRPIRTMARRWPDTSCRG